MAANPDWLPRNHEALYDQAKQTWNYLSDPVNRKRMGFAANTPQNQWLETFFEPKYNDFNAAFVRWQNPAERTPVISERFFIREKAFGTVYRQLYTGFLKSSPLVTDQDLVGMGLPKRPSGNRKPVAIPDKHPAYKADTAEMRRITILFYENDGAYKRAKPAGIHGAEIRWVVRDSFQVVHIDELIHSSFNTHSPITFDFADEQRGKFLFFALRWENNRGQKGPFGPVENAIIP